MTDLIPHMFSGGSETSQRLYPSSPEVFSEKQPSVTTSTVAEVCWWCRENSQLGVLLPLLQVGHYLVLLGGFSPTHLKNMIVKLGSSSPRDRGENKKIFELPPPRTSFSQTFVTK